jgi:hypothetical protein
VKMNQWLANLSPFEVYLIAVPSIMLGSILFLGGIIRLLEHRNGDDAAH